MDILTETAADRTIGRLTGRMDTLTTKTFDQWFSNQVEQGRTHLVLDMNELMYISSSGLRSLLAAAKQIKAAGGTLVLCGLTGVVRQVFQLSGFYTIFEIVDDIDKADMRPSSSELRQ